MVTNNSVDEATAASGKVLQGQGVGTASAFSTATYPATTTINQVLYSSAANVVAGLATANNGILITSAAGVPSILADGTTGQVLTATTGSPPSWVNGGPVLLSTVTPVAATSVQFTSGFGSYKTLLIFGVLALGTANGQILLQISTNGGSTYTATGYQAGINYTTWNLSVFTNASPGTGFILSDTTSSNGSNAVFFQGYLYNFGTAGIAAMTGNSTFANAGFTAFDLGYFGGTSGNTGPNAFRIINNGASGTITGTISVFGVF
jgi:hypothetical protein